MKKLWARTITALALAVMIVAGFAYNGGDLRWDYFVHPWAIGLYLLTLALALVVYWVFGRDQSNDSSRIIP